MNGIALERDVGHGLFSLPTAAQVGRGLPCCHALDPPVVLLAASALASARPTADPPVTDDLSGLIGQPAPGWKLDHWFNSEPLALEDLRGKVVLVRWFVAPSCPFCSATAPTPNRFDEEYRGRGLVVIGVYLGTAILYEHLGAAGARSLRGTPQ